MQAEESFEGDRSHQLVAVRPISTENSRLSWFVRIGSMDYALQKEYDFKFCLEVRKNIAQQFQYFIWHHCLKDINEIMCV